MKKQILNIGKALNRSDQLKIKGGDCQYDNIKDCKRECSVDCMIDLDEDIYPSQAVWVCNDTSIL